MKFERKLTAVVLAVSAALPLSLTASIANAQTYYRNGAVNTYAATPRVDSFNVNQIERV